MSALVSKARQIDKDNYLRKINGSNVGYSNNAYNYFLSGKLSFDHFTVGFRTWKNHEGFNYYQDLYEAGSKNGNVWAPKNTTFYSIYDRQFENLSITNICFSLTQICQNFVRLLSSSGIFRWLS